jgi:hypothetical protein
MKGLYRFRRSAFVNLNHFYIYYARDIRMVMPHVNFYIVNKMSLFF